jgi:hypothetical protein
MMARIEAPLIAVSGTISGRLLTNEEVSNSFDSLCSRLNVFDNLDFTMLFNIDTMLRLQMF